MASNARATVLHLPQTAVTGGSRHENAEFSPSVLKLYRFVARSGPVPLDDAVRGLHAAYPAVVEDRAELVSLGLIRDTPRGLVAVPPGQAIDELLQEQSSHLAEALEALRYRQARLRALFKHRPMLQAGDETEISTISLGDDEAEEPLSALTEPASSLNAIHPGASFSPDLLSASLERAERLASRGVRLRVIHQRSALAHPKLVNYLLSLQNSGVRVRVRDHLPARMLLVDEAAAICTLSQSDGGGGQTFLLRGDKVVTLLSRVFDSTWLDATTVDAALHGAARFPVREESDRSLAPSDVPGASLTSVQASILKALAEGQTDQAIARSLGITSRTVTRRVAEIYEVLGVESRFQAGIEARRRGLV